MSEKYGSHKEWTFGMECELPYKVCFALDKSPDSMTFLEVKRGGDTVIRLFSDMGGKTRTIEMITGNRAQSESQNHGIFGGFAGTVFQRAGSSTGDGH